MSNSKSRDKGTRGEYAVRDLLRDATGWQWERTPGSGALSANKGLKGDLFLPSTTKKIGRYCIEVKHYKDEHFNSNILKPAKTTTQFEKWLQQAEREAEEIAAIPMLIFKKDRSPWYVAIPMGEPLLDYLEDIVEPYAIVKVSKDVQAYFVLDFKLFLEHVPKEELVL